MIQLREHLSGTATWEFKAQEIFDRGGRVRVAIMLERFPWIGTVYVHEGKTPEDQACVACGESWEELEASWTGFWSRCLPKGKRPLPARPREPRGRRRVAAATPFQEGSLELNIGAKPGEPLTRRMSALKEHEAASPEDQAYALRNGGIHAPLATRPRRTSGDLSGPRFKGTPLPLEMQDHLEKNVSGR